MIDGQKLHATRMYELDHLTAVDFHGYISDSMSTSPFRYETFRDLFNDWAEINIPEIHWSRFTFGEKRIMFYHRDDAMMAYLRFA